MEQTIGSVLLFVPFNQMLHRQLTSRFKEVRHLRWVGISPFKASTCLDPAFKQGSHRLALPSARFAIAFAAFRSLRQPGVPSQGAAEPILQNRWFCKEQCWKDRLNGSV